MHICKKCGIEKAADQFAGWIRRDRGTRARDPYCRECRVKMTRKWKDNLPPERREELRAEIKEYNHARYMTDLEASRAYFAERARGWRARHPWHRARFYGLTAEQARMMAEEQDHRCAICREKPDKFHFDHDHKTGAMRSLLCSSCNLALGALKDDPARFRFAANYLERHNSALSYDFDGHA